jgi:translation initiation factor IF-2
MTPEERKKYLDEKNQLKEIFRTEDLMYKHYPLIIKASSAGTLETLIHELDKRFRNSSTLQLIDYGIGPISEGDMANAVKTEAVIFGFDVGCHPPVEKKASPEGCCIRLHKLIHKFEEDIENYSKYAELDTK